MTFRSSDTRLLAVYDGRTLRGFVLTRGARRGAEAFDRDEQSLGLFRDMNEAHVAIERAFTEGSSLYTWGSSS